MKPYTARRRAPSTPASGLSTPARPVPGLRWRGVLAAAGLAALAACGGGNDNAPPERAAAVPDTAAPVLSILNTVAEGATATAPFTLTFRFSESVGTSFTVDDILVNGGTKGAFTRTGPTEATLVVQPTAGLAGFVIVTVPTGAFADGAGNGNTAAIVTRQQVDMPGDPVAPVTDERVNFEEAVAPNLIGFGGIEEAAVVPDPTDATNRVARITKGAGAEAWAGVTIATLPGDAVPRVALRAGRTTATARVWSPDAGITVRLKIEDAGNRDVSVETDATVTTAAGWQTLTFNFANHAAGTPALNFAATYDKVSIFLNFGQSGAQAGGAKTYYVDDITWPAEGGGDGIARTTIGFNEPSFGITPFEGLGAAAVADDPASAGNAVLRMVKAPGGQPWAGATVFTTASGQSVGPIGFAATKVITMRVYAPAAGKTIMVKVEDSGDRNVFMEATAVTTASGAWETLSFDFAAPSNGAFDAARTYDRISLFPNFMTVPAADEEYFFDDLAFPAPTGG
jgi:hypothetical protein